MTACINPNRNHPNSPSSERGEKAKAKATETETGTGTGTGTTKKRTTHHLSTRTTPRTLDPSTIRADIQFVPVDYNRPNHQPTVQDFEPAAVTEFDSGRVAQPFLDPDALARAAAARERMRRQER